MLKTRKNTMKRSRKETFYCVCCDCSECLETEGLDAGPFQTLSGLFDTEWEARKALKVQNKKLGINGIHDSLFVSKYVTIEAEQRPRAQKPKKRKAV